MLDVLCTYEMIEKTCQVPIYSFIHSFRAGVGVVDKLHGGWAWRGKDPALAACQQTLAGSQGTSPTVTPASRPSSGFVRWKGSDRYWESAQTDIGNLHIYYMYSYMLQTFADDGEKGFHPFLPSESKSEQCCVQVKPPRPTDGRGQSELTVGSAP